MPIAWSIPIPLIRQQVVWDIRACTGLYSAALTVFFFFLLWWIGHKSQFHGNRRTERENSVSWHGSSRGLSTFETIPALLWRMSFWCVCPWQCLLMHLLCSDRCFLFISSISSLISLSREAPCALLVEIWVRSELIQWVWALPGTGCGCLRAADCPFSRWLPLQPSDIKVWQCTPPSVV